MSTSRSTRCLDAAVLQRFLGEQLDESTEASVQEHVGSCVDCQRALEGVAGDPALWSGLREHLAHAPLAEPSADPVDSDLQDLIEILGPTDDPRMLGRLGVYEVCGLIGRGATGLVMKALEPRLNRYVAIKLMSPSYSSSGSARRRFEREGRAVAAVSHEHVVPIYAVDDHRGLPYIVMKYIPGLSLEQRIERDGPLDTCAVTRVGLQVAKALAAAHTQGIVHRDVKPANVILEDTVERALVTDFGLARVADEASMTRSGTITGTPQFMSPEQARGDAVDQRSDLFSLGSLLYAACTGRPPFRAETIYGVINRVCDTQPRPIREINPEIATWLAAFVDKLMSKRPEDRFQSAAEVATALTSELAYLQSPMSAARPPREWLVVSAVSPGSTVRKRVRMGLMAIGIVVLGGFALSRFRESMENSSERAATIVGLSEFAGQDEHDMEAARGAPAIRWMRRAGDVATGSAPTFEQTLVQSFPIAGEGRLTMRVDRGGVEVRPGAPDGIQVTVVRRVSAESEAMAAEFLERHEVRLQHEHEELVVNARTRTEPGQSSSSGVLESVRYRVQVPAGIDVDVRTLQGGITIGTLAADVRAEAHGGDILLARVAGTVWARTDGGSVDASEGMEDHAEILAIGGDVRLAKAAKSASILTSNGDVFLGPSSGDVSAQTSGGNVSVNEVAGPIGVHAAGGSIFVRLTENPKQDARFSAADGDVNLELDHDVVATIEAQGNLETSLPFDAVGTEGWLVSRQQGGGPKIRVTATTGALRVAHSDSAGSLDSGDSLGGSSQVGIRDLRGGSGLGGSASLGASRGGGGSSGGSRSLGGSGGLGGSSSGPGESSTHAARIADGAALPVYAREKTTGPPRPGALVAVPLADPVGALDGYTLYLPLSHDERVGTFPILIYLQGAYGVGGPIGDLNHWGLSRLVRDESDLSIERNRLLLDEFIIIALHIQEGGYFDEPAVVDEILDDVSSTYKADPERIYLTGLSRGGHGSWGLAAVMPDTFAAIAPAGGNAGVIGDLSRLVNTSIWIAHNEDDGAVPFSSALDAARRIEEASGVDFLRARPVDIAGTNYLERKYVFTSSPNGGHDAWTDLYSRPEFYKWLLRQRLQRSSEREESFR